MTVLLVEDDPGTTTALRTILARKGWKVSAVTTLAEGVQRLADQPFSVIVDLMLPDGSGLFLIEEIRRQGLECRVVVTTGSHDYDQLQKVSNLRPNAVLRKPIDLAELIRSISGS